MLCYAECCLPAVLWRDGLFTAVPCKGVRLRTAMCVLLHFLLCRRRCDGCCRTRPLSRQAAQTPLQQQPWMPAVALCMLWPLRWMRLSMPQVGTPSSADLCAAGCVQGNVCVFCQPSNRLES